MIPDRYAIDDPSALFSPSLLIYRAIVRSNIAAMLAMARSPERLRPHAKTHKMAAVIRMFEDAGVHKHKCATIAEAEMIAAAGGLDVLIAYPIVGPNLQRLARLVAEYQSTTFRVVVDDLDTARELSAAMDKADRPLATLVDLEIGMGRTGVAPGDDAADLYALVDRLPNLQADGLHAYDGHVKDLDIEDRRRAVARGIEPTLDLRDRLIASGLDVPRLVLGGTPTFPIHTALDEPDVECSPGTSTFYDAGYSARFPDLPFEPAAALLTRVVSRPRPGRLCLDLGHKAVAADPVGDRLTLLNVEGVRFAGQSEEHLIVDIPDSANFPPGTPLLALPAHVCPTCALHRQAYVIEDGKLVDRWDVTARDRMIGI